MSISDAERRRQERRQRILNNQGARLQKILGPNSNFSIPATEGLDLSPSADQPWEDEDANTTLTTTTSPIRSSEYRNSSAYEDGQTVRTRCTLTSNNGNPLVGIGSGPAGQPQHRALSSDGTTDPPPQELKTESNPKISVKQHHLFLFLLGLSLTIFGANYFILYLIIYEFTLVAINGFSLPLFYSSKNSMFALFLLYGVPEVYRRTFQEAAILLNWFTTDLTIFISSALVLPLVQYVAA